MTVKTISTPLRLGDATRRKVFNLFVTALMGLFALMESSGSAHNFLDHNVVSSPGIEWPEPIDWTPPDV